jgi:TIR domain
MQQATSSAGRTIAVLSPAYLASPYGTDEWTGAFLHDKDREGRLLPVRIEACALPRLLATRCTSTWSSWAALPTSVWTRMYAVTTSNNLLVSCRVVGRPLDF